MTSEAVVLVEGVSDRVALEVLARRRGMDLAAHGVSVVAMHGITNIGHFLAHYRYGEATPGKRIAGLYDEAEERFVVRGLGQVGLLDERPERGERKQRVWLESLGFFSCSVDLEDELIRALGPDAVEALVAAEGELRSFRTLQKQPALRERSLQHQLRRLMGGRSGGKERYAALMAEAVEPARIPRPLTRVLDYVAAGVPGGVAGLARPAPSPSPASAERESPRARSV
ncbi:TOPRIM nucleotidyl transferase/hydrolase domain-containing protein [Streptacidiphilus pinicola]|uniref:TOPRIM nucleotidyl transferase/hydrolase domain-containing protein n=1 Tax=Streptacidiphilus pinicola TaxID=2219663 RepID=UPI001A9CBDE4|nr:TOPRIM nucleotidyl transferase/hydrolase domain-containing protein [Streptacidiphilus pinicola]